MDVTSRNMKKFKTSEEEDESDAESEILIWIDFAQTDHPRLRNPLETIPEETKLQNSISEIKNKNIKDASQTFKSDEDNDSFFNHENLEGEAIKANSEKLIKQPKLLNPENKDKATEKKSTDKECSNVKDGKSFDNTNASVHDNEFDSKNIIVNKEDPVKINSSEEPVSPVKVQVDGLENNDVYREWGLNFGDDNASYHSDNFMKNTDKNHLIDEGKDFAMDDDHQFENNDFEIEYSDKMPVIENPKEADMHEFGDGFDLKELNNDNDKFSHHSNLLNNEFDEIHSSSLNYF